MVEKQHEIILYQMDDTNVCINVIYEDETFWLTQKAMAELFEVNVPAISKHLSNIFEEGELEREATVSKMEIVQHYHYKIDNARLRGKHYDLRC